jgi:hypothetical protein
MRRFTHPLFALALTAGLAVPATVPAQPPGYPGPQRGSLDRVLSLTDQMADELSTLREDIDIELPDARGEALAAQADRSLEQIRHLQKSVRRGASPEHLREHAAEMARGLHRFLDMTADLGPDGRFLRRSAKRIHALDHELMEILSRAQRPGPRGSAPIGLVGSAVPSQSLPPGSFDFEVSAVDSFNPRHTATGFNGTGTVTLIGPAGGQLAINGTAIRVNQVVPATFTNGVLDMRGLKVLTPGTYFLKVTIDGTTISVSFNLSSFGGI